MSKWEERCRDEESLFTGAAEKGATDSEDNEDTKKKNAKFNRKYDDSYIKLGFVTAEDASAPNPLCVVCGEKLANEVMKRWKLLRPALNEKPVEYFELNKTVKCKC